MGELVVHTGHGARAAHAGHVVRKLRGVATVTADATRGQLVVRFDPRERALPRRIYAALRPIAGADLKLTAGTRHWPKLSKLPAVLASLA